MIGSLPRYQQLPLDYRYALDGAMVPLHKAERILVRLPSTPWEEEVTQRLPQAQKQGSADAGLWIEPGTRTWEHNLQDFRSGLSENGLLVVIASRPLARILPQKSWENHPPLGIQITGMRRLRQGLVQADFCIESCYGVHTLAAILWNQAGQWMGRCCRPDLEDRWQFAARLRYHTLGRWAFLSTVALIFAYKRGEGCGK